MTRIRQIIQRHTSPKLQILALLALFGAFTGNASEPLEARSAGQALEARANKHGVEVIIQIDPGEVILDQDLLLTIRATAPTDSQLQMPAVHNRLQGFDIVSAFDSPVVETPDGKRIYERTLRLTPMIAERYRIAPMAIAISRPQQAARNSDPTVFLLTPPITLNTVSPYPDELDDSPRAAVDPLYVRPSWRDITGYAMLLVFIILVASVLFKLASKIKRRIKIAMLPPVERALHDLQLLINENLPAKGQTKTFYIRITAIIRRYIEKRYHIRAPEQTTEEFLAQAASSSAFDQVAISKLQPFLEAADRVKFAGWSPNTQIIETTVNTAQEYLTSESAQPDQKTKEDQR